MKKIIDSLLTKKPPSLKAHAITLPTADYFERLIISDIDGEIDPAAIFEVKSVNGGFLLPRVTTAEKITMTAAAGLMVYDTDEKRANAYTDDGDWRPLEDGTVKEITAGDGLDFDTITETGSVSLKKVATHMTIPSPGLIEIDEFGRVLSLVRGPVVAKIIGHKVDSQVVTGAADYTAVTWGTDDFIETEVGSTKSYLTGITLNLGIGSKDNNKKYVQGIFEYSDDGKATWKTFGQLPNVTASQTACHFGTVINPANTDGLTLISYSTQALITTTDVPTDSKLYFRVKVRAHTKPASNNFVINATADSTFAYNMVMSSNFAVTISE